MNDELCLKCDGTGDYRQPSEVPGVFYRQKCPDCNGSGQRKEKIITPFGDPKKDSPAVMKAMARYKGRVHQLKRKEKKEDE